MSSFGIVRTNVGLTTNVKVMVSSGYDLFLESIDSDIELSNSKFKKFRFNKDNYYDELVPYFFRDLPSDISFRVKYDNDNDKMFKDFDKQFDDIYQCGCRNILDNKGYTEEFECFAPLYIYKNSIPKNFIIFRIDGPGLVNLNKDNFKSEIVNKLKCVKNFDLTRNTVLGEWIDINFRNNNSFPISPFSMDFRSMEFSSWNGIDMDSGGYTRRSSFFESTLDYENTFFDFEKKIYDGYRNNKIAFPNIINFSFLFDDTPATPSSLRKWSINRYMGFYFDEIEVINSVSTYIPLSVKSDVIIQTGNILNSISSSYPFVEDWKKVDTIYIEVSGVFYKVQKFDQVTGSSLNRIKLSDNSFTDQYSNNSQTYYKIISNIDLSGLTFSSINQNIINIDSNNKLLHSDGTDYQINEYDTSDVWLINIDDKFHVLNKIGTSIYINTDYAFEVSSDTLKYWINSPDKNYTHIINMLVDANNPPKTFKIYRCKFSDIKDFDTSIVDTEFSKFEYEKKSTLTQTDETKLYVVDYNGENIPKDIEDYNINGQVVNIPTSSEYTANGELFRIINNDLNPLWRKNSERVKFGFQNSISSNDYPYLLNNSFISEDYNRTTNPFDTSPNRIERNLDYFYTINSSTSSYIHHTLHIEDHDTPNFNFELSKYLDVSTYSVDYFTHFFGKKSSFDSGNIIKNTKKWSCFNQGDNVIPNNTLFRGIKFNIFDVDSIKVSNGNIENINTKSSNTYQDYKFSILLSKNDIGLTGSTNSLSWKIIDSFKYDKTYYSGDIVSYHDILFMSSTSSTITNPSDIPSAINGWSYYTDTIFWSPSQSYTSSSNPIYNGGEYYEPISNSDVNSGLNFWIPGKLYYVGSEVIYNNSTWISTISGNISEPMSSNQYYQSASYSLYWDKSSSISDKWSIVELWSSDVIYNINKYIVYEGILYKSLINNSINILPSLDSSKWRRVYGLNPDTNFTYTSSDNNIINMNNRYYLCIGNSNLSTLEDGIVIYINKKWKNVLINIYINDNTLLNLYNTDRDTLYTDLYSKLTAYNFMNCVNSLSNRYGFSDYLKYVIVDSASTKSYNIDNISELPIVISCDPPDQFFSRIKSLDKKSNTLYPNQFKANRKLENATVTTLDMLDWYNDSLSLGTEIERIRYDDVIIPNYHGLSNNIYNNVFRHSGDYSPIFYDIELFDRSTDLVGNYKFDTTLTEFGIIKEEIISKVNRGDNILKLRDKLNIKSIYPMIDEFGYTIADIFMFKSTWDYEHLLECVNTLQSPKISSNESIKVNFVENNSML